MWLWFCDLSKRCHLNILLILVTGAGAGPSISSWFPFVFVISLKFLSNDERFFLCFIFLSATKDYSGQFTKRRVIQLFSVLQFLFANPS